MEERVLMKGNEALCEGAVIAGCRYYFGYPITPQNEVPAYMSRRLPQVGGVFLQAESELAAINMVWGASCSGKRVMTSSSSPGISLMQEGISYLAGAELPTVIVNMVRGGPGLGNIAPAQSDYFQATRGGGHGDYYTIVLGPSTVQELANTMVEAFDLADIYRTPVIVLGDGVLGQMMEPLVLPESSKRIIPEKDWKIDGAKGRKARIVRSLRLNPQTALEELNLKLRAKYEKIMENEVRYEEYHTEDAKVIIVAFGTSSRIVRSVVNQLREEGKNVGLFRPITLWPYPYKRLRELSENSNVKAFIDVEMNLGQMLEDVKLAVNGNKKVLFYGRTAGMIPEEEVLIEKVLEVY